MTKSVEKVVAFFNGKDRECDPVRDESGKIVEGIVKQGEKGYRILAADGSWKYCSEERLAKLLEKAKGNLHEISSGYKVREKKVEKFEPEAVQAFLDKMFTLGQKDLVDLLSEKVKQYKVALKKPSEIATTEPAS